MLGGEPIIVLKAGTERERGKDAQFNNIAAAKAVAEAVRSTLGPKGMDKMLVDSMGDVTITNDGVTILKEMDIKHPAAKMVVEIAKTQDDECGDGTTTAVVLAGELLKKAENLVELNVHPTTLVNGYKLAAKEAVSILSKMGFQVKPTDTKKMIDIAATSMAGRSVGPAKDYLADIVVRAITSVAEKRDNKTVADVDNVKVEKKHGGSVYDTELISGIIIDKERVHPRMPTSVKNAKIAILDFAMEIKKTEVDAKIQITDPNQLQKFLDEEERILREMADKVAKSGANVVLCQKGIDDLAQHYLAKKGIFALRRIKKSDMKKLARATSGRVVSTLDDLKPSDLGAAALVEERKVGDDDMTFITGCKNPKAVSILIRGGTEHVVDEIERSLNDALKVVALVIEDGRAVPGGGAPEVELSLRLREFATTVGGREQLAIEAFAKAMEIIPWTLGENAGLDSIDLLIKLKSKHEGKKGNKNEGFNVKTGGTGDMLKLKIIEPLGVKTQAIESATEVASMILRIDDVIASKKMEGGGGPPGGMPPGGMGGMPPGMM
ncbi:MAG: thermosome subunit beta [Thermoplasmata archaeon]